MNTNQKITSLAIDALTQFRAGVDTVRIGNITISANEAFKVANDSSFSNIVSDEERNITALEHLITALAFGKAFENDSTVEKELKNASVEYINVNEGAN